MHYAGGKSRIGQQIATFLESVRRSPDQTYIEPFVGASNVLCHMSGPRAAYDAHPDLILLWQAILDGWRPPSIVTPKLYRSLRNSEPSALRAFVGFGCSWGGKFFGGFARCSRGRNYALDAANSLRRKAARLCGVPFTRADYSEISQRQSLIYCDPPYAGTMPFRGVAPFDHAAFWQRVRDWENAGNDVFVSEATAPDDFEPVLEVAAPVGMSAKGSPRRQEFVFRLKGKQPTG